MGCAEHTGAIWCGLVFLMPGSWDFTNEIKWNGAGPFFLVDSSLAKVVQETRRRFIRLRVVLATLAGPDFLKGEVLLIF